MQLTKLRLTTLALLFFVANLFLKTLFITANPSGMTYDEVIYAAEAQSIVKYGTDLTGQWRPWHFEPSDSYYTELTSTMLTPGFILFPNSPILASKFMPLLLGSLIPILLGLIAYKLRKDTAVFALTAFFATLNPWIFQFSRMGYDSLFSIGFYLIAMVCILYAQNWKKLWAVLPATIGFFQYQGHKPLLVPLALLCLLFLILENYEVKKIVTQYKKILTDKNILAAFAVVLFSVALTVLYLVRLPQLSSGERISEFSIYDATEISSRVNDQRRMSLASPLTVLFENKYTALFTTLTQRFLDSFNVNRLFISGDAAVDTFTVLDYGYFHIIDILILIIALAYLLHRKQDHAALLFIIGFIVIGTIPNVIRTGASWIIFRAAFAFLGLLLLMGTGTAEFLKLHSRKHVVLLILLYSMFTTPFLYAYFVTYPISHTRNIGFYERVVASYLTRIENGTPVVIIPDRDDATFNYLIHYNQLLTKENEQQVNTALTTRVFEVDALKIPGNCPNHIDEISFTTTFVYLMNQPCEVASDPTEITEIKSLVDSGTIFTIYNDKLCSQYSLPAYPHVTKNVFAVEQLSDQEFCETFFSR